MRLVESGLNDCEVSRRLGVPRSTIRDWRRPTYVPKQPSVLETCPRCWRATRPLRFTHEDYNELLGLYLGDGHISEFPRTFRLRITLDAKYPDIIRNGHALLRRCFPSHRSSVQRKGMTGKCANLSLYSSHLPCLFPQHGPGPKHARDIHLETWQRDSLERAPWAFLAGCIRSDGCAFVNRTDIHRVKPYEYLSYEFSNKSKDILDLFVSTCRRVGVDVRVNCDRRGRWSVRINRRPSVALMLEHVGLKS
jgi:hypothetical protein